MVWCSRAKRISVWEGWLASAYWHRDVLWLAGFRRLLPEEFFSTFKECKEPKLPSHSYCLDESNPESLAWIVVDHASTARRFYDKVSKIVADRLPYDGFRKLFEAHRFQIVVLTAEEQKVNQIRSVFNERCPQSVPVSVIAIPGLLQFLL